MNLKIYTKKPHNYFSKEFLKEIGRFVFRKSRGPQAVVNSLIRGLSELGENFDLNDKNPKLNGSEIFFINSSIDALKWAIKLKKEKKIKKLIAGPNLVVSPNDYNDIIISDEIDLILLASQWVVDFVLLFNQSISEKIKIWPSGVKDYGINNSLIKKDKILVYVKNPYKNSFIEVVNFLDKNFFDYDILKYGSHSRKKYFNVLDSCSCMIYLQKTESQGLGLLEAWMKNVPTFVWGDNIYERDDKKIICNYIAAPYLNKDCGLFINSIEELSNVLDNFFNKKSFFIPRQYYLNNFTNKICAQKFINLITDNK